jgi:hypothetical protein
MDTLEHLVRKQLNEAFNLPKLELLVRLGLMPLQSLPILRRAISRVQSGTMLTPDDRQVIALLLDKLMNMSFNDSAIFQRMRTIVTQTRNSAMKSTPVAEKADPTLKRMPEGMLDTLATNVQSKKRSGGKLSPEDKRVASRAKAELRRRRDNRNSMRESYENAFLSVMQEYNITNIAELSQENAKEFFNKVEHLYNSGE